MLVIVVLVILAAIAIVAVASLAAPRARGRRMRGPTDRSGRVRRRRTTDERVLLSEGEAIQRRVEARLSARGVPSHRLSGPNPPTGAEQLARNDRRSLRRSRSRTRSGDR
jgi:hypothetical protein